MSHTRTVHVTAAALGASLIATFWLSTALSLLLWPSRFGAVHHWILRAIPVLIGVEIVAGLSGRKLAGRRQDALVKRKRALSLTLALNGLLVLLPCACVLRHGPPEGPLPYVELTAGALQLMLLSALAATGRRLRARRTHAPAAL